MYLKIAEGDEVSTALMAAYLSIIVTASLVDTPMVLCYKLSRDVPSREGGWAIACISSLSKVVASPFSNEGKWVGACL